jgi:hypothetical protein
MKEEKGPKDNIMNGLMMVGCHQKGGTWHHSFFKRISFGVNYNETFALIAKFVSIRCILALITIESMKIHQMTVKIAILNGDLQKEIYMEQPKDSHKEVISMVSQHMANPTWNIGLW